jgi:outer membrane protein assembly factor BamB
MMKTRLGCVALLLALMGTGFAAYAQPPAASGGWTYLVDAEHTGKVPEALPLPLVLVWRYDTGQGGPSISTPALDNERVYFVAPKPVPAAGGMMPGPGMAPPGPGVPVAPGPGMPMPATMGQPTTTPGKSVLYAVSRKTGALAWKLDTDVEVTCGLAVSEGFVFFGAADGRLWAVNAATGDKSWRFEARLAIRSAPLLKDNMLYFGSDDHRVYAYDLVNKALIWQFETSAPVQSTPVVYRDTVFVPSQDGYLYALRADNGTVIWRQALSSNQVYSSPMIERDKVVVAAGPYLMALDARYGDRRWVFTAGDLIVGTPTVSGRNVLIGSRDGVIYAINDLTGRAVWRYPAAEAGPPIQCSPLLAGEALLVRRGNRDVVALNQSDGQLLWEYTLPALPGGAEQQPAGGMPGAPPVPGAPAMPGVPGGGGVPAGYEPTTGLPLYSTVVRSGAIVQGGQAFLVGDDGAIYGFTAQASDALKPEVKQGVLQVQVQQQPYAYQLRAVRGGALAPPPTKDDVLQIPGAPPIWLHAEVLDPGTGINPAAVRVLVDGQPVGLDQLFFEADKSVIWWIYDPVGVAATNLPNGMHKVTIQATDWANNTGEASIYFLVDNSLSAPKVPGQEEAQPGMMPGMPGAPGVPVPPGAPMPPPPPPPIMR